MTKANDAAAAIAAKYKASGLACEIEAGPHGLVIYAGCRVDANVVATDIARQVQPRDPKARVTLAQKDGSGDEARGHRVVGDRRL